MVFGIVLIVLVLLLVLWIIGAYNGLMKLKKLVENAWAQIDVQLHRRHDLIPNLVNSVKGYMKFEQETLEKVIEARSKAVNPGSNNVKDIADAENQLTGALSKLLVVVEKYPDLKANQNVRDLMEQLTTTENKIAYSRQFYNDSTTKYNTKLSLFPTNIIAGMFKFTERALFEAPEEAKKVPIVNLEF